MTKSVVVTKTAIIETKGITHCIQCPFHKRVLDPDPHDHFNDDDEALLCTKMKPAGRDMKSYRDKKDFEFKPIAVSLRPYQVNKEEVPKWCPLPNEES